MSNSRLEKFIYAICGMDIDDLPTPLSRIETLWNCLITGGMPDFEPLSRNEKYLMAMLTDNVDGLPEPTSRGEKLLYKIATGETDLSDVPGYLSRYEELLKQLIENGGIGGTDFEYVLYTLNQPLSTLYSTAEAPVKSAILKGQTLVNLSPFKSLMDVTPSVLNENSVVWYGSVNKEYFNYSMFKPNTKYIVKFGLGTPSRFKGTYISGLNMPNKNGYYTEHNDIFTTPQTIPTEGNLYLKGIDGDVVTKEEYSKIEVMIIEYQEGMENWDIPYFDGMQSVKMPVLTTTGKNLFDIEKAENKYFTLDLNLVDVVDNSGVKTSDYIKVKPNTTYTFIQGGIDFTSAPHNVWFTYAFYKNKTGVVCDGYDKRQGGDAGVKQQLYHRITTPKDCEYLKVGARFLSYDNAWGMLVEGDYISSLTYEPYKSNILTVNEEVELGSVGDVKDELNLLTGELTQRIGQELLNTNNPNIKLFRTAYHHNTNNLCAFDIQFDNEHHGNKLMSDKLTNHKNTSISPSIKNYLSHIFIVRIPFKEDGTNPTLEEFKAWLDEVNPTVYYNLPTESVKTVALSTLDQDGQPTKLSTFNDITHVSIEAEDLLPTVDLEVPTKIEATLSTLPTLMNDISETQQLLNETIDDQAGDINEVSTAITEIRSDIL